MAIEGQQMFPEERRRDVVSLGTCTLSKTHQHASAAAGMRGSKRWGVVFDNGDWAENVRLRGPSIMIVDTRVAM